MSQLYKSLTANLFNLTNKTMGVEIFSEEKTDVGINLSGIKDVVGFMEKYRELIIEKIRKMSPEELSIFFTSIAEYGFSKSEECNNGERGQGVKWNESIEIVKGICDELGIQYS